MRNAFMAGTLTRRDSGHRGYLSLRRLAFAGYALAHIGFEEPPGRYSSISTSLWD
jgi:hypothetical protein